MYLKLILCSMSIMSQLKKTQLPPLEDPLVLLFIAELIIFSPNLLLLSAALFLLEPLLSSQASSLKLQRCLTPYFQGPSTEKEHHLHLSFLSTSSVAAPTHYVNLCGLFSKSAKSSSSLQSPTQIMNCPGINLHKAHPPGALLIHSKIFNSSSLHTQ